MSSQSIPSHRSSKIVQTHLRFAPWDLRTVVVSAQPSTVRCPFRPWPPKPQSCWRTAMAAPMAMAPRAHPVRAPRAAAGSGGSCSWWWTWPCPYLSGGPCFPSFRTEAWFLVVGFWGKSFWEPISFRLDLIFRFYSFQVVYFWVLLRKTSFSNHLLSVLGQSKECTIVFWPFWRC